MGEASLTLQISDLLGEPPRDALTLVFRAASFTVQARFPETAETTYTVNGIPCRGGVSHRPDEYASPEAIAAGVEVLARSLAELAKE